MSDHTTLCARLRELSYAVTRGRDGMREFDMRVPAEPERDADLVLSRAATLIEQQAARIAELETAEEESDAVRMGMAKLLTGVANALRGDPPELTSWSWHDLPERAAAAIRAIAVMEAAARDSARMVAELEAAARWRPIESAPKNGTEIIGWREDSGPFLTAWTCLCEFMPEDAIERLGIDAQTSEKHAWFYADIASSGMLDDDLAPTHWLPIPAFEEPQP